MPVKGGRCANIFFQKKRGGGGRVSPSRSRDVVKVVLSLRSIPVGGTGGTDGAA